ncbi:MAG: helix-turn-helix domain-containing protein [Betaproteobacteria bacterium]|nr:helix-turn-helix domain-containing protein [Betaproteobacteria bacterium]
MDRNDAALMAAQDAIVKAAAGKDKTLCADVVDAVVPFFPEALRQQCRIVSVEAGQLISDRNPDRPNIHRLLWGDVSIQREVMGEVLTVQRAAAGDWLIESAAGEHAAGSFAICERASVLLAIPSEALTESLDLHAGFAQAWFQEVGRQMARMQRRIERLNLRQAPQRIIHYLLTESTGGSGDMVLPFRKGVWAAHLGMAPETLSRALGDLADAGWLKMLRGRRFLLLRTA